MPLYVALTNWTDQGLRNVRDTVELAATFIAAAEKMECRVHDLMWTIGPYDIVSIIEAPDDEAATSLMLAMEMQGNLRTHMMRAHRKEDMNKILGRLP
jgi:uncharacterized protein with GYD domain